MLHYRSSLDRLYANIEFGPVELLAGRNILSIGPGRHTQLIWGDQPPPLDQIGLSVHTLKIPRIPVEIGGKYVVGWLDSR